MIFVGSLMETLDVSLKIARNEYHYDIKGLNSIKRKQKQNESDNKGSLRF